MRLLMIVTTVSSWTGLLLQLFLTMQLLREKGASIVGALVTYLSFFTILTNLLIAITLTICLLHPGGRLGRVANGLVVQSGLALYIAVVGATYVLLLRDVWEPRGWQKVADVLLHYAVPLLYLLYWAIFLSKKMLPWISVGLWTVYPLAYLCYAMVRGALVNWYPYPFVDVSTLGYGRVAANASGLLAVFLLLAAAMVGFSRWIGHEGAMGT